jgi:predicted HicB family RNase H-like nuclease
MNTLSYKGYVARIKYDAISRSYVGHVAGIDDLIGFSGSTVDSLKKGFHVAVDDYLDVCKLRGRAPQKPYSVIHGLKHARGCACVR